MNELLLKKAEFLENLGRVSSRAKATLIEQYRSNIYRTWCWGEWLSASAVLSHQHPPILSYFFSKVNGPAARILSPKSPHHYFLLCSAPTSALLFFGFKLASISCNPLKWCCTYLHHTVKCCAAKVSRKRLLFWEAHLWQEAEVTNTTFKSAKMTKKKMSEGTRLLQDLLTTGQVPIEEHGSVVKQLPVIIFDGPACSCFDPSVWAACYVLTFMSMLWLSMLCLGLCALCFNLRVHAMTARLCCDP